MVSHTEPTKREMLLMDLSRVPIASTRQLSQRYSSNSSPLKKVSQDLVELEKEKMVQWDYYKREKVWKLTRKARQLLNISAQRYKSVEHALSIGQVYFTLKPNKWLYEPVEHFKHGDKKFAWSPDCIFVHNKRIHVAEVQLNPLSKKSWEKKYSIWNLYFQETFKTAQFQAWSSSGLKMPEFLCISNQSNVTGLSIPGRELKVIKSIAEL